MSSSITHRPKFFGAAILITGLGLTASLLGAGVANAGPPPPPPSQCAPPPAPCPPPPPR